MDILERRKISSTFGSTYLFHQFVLSGRTFPDLNTILIAGAVIKKELISKLRTTFPRAYLKSAYASTEADLLTFGEIFDKLDSSGKVEQNVELKVSEENKFPNH